MRQRTVIRSRLDNGAFKELRRLKPVYMEKKTQQRSCKIIISKTLSVINKNNKKVKWMNVNCSKKYKRKFNNGY